VAAASVEVCPLAGRPERLGGDVDDRDLGVLGGVFGVGQMTVTRATEASAFRTYTLRLGDKVAIPAVGQVCSVTTEGGAVELFCARPRSAHHQVTFFRDNILVWKAGNPNRPRWSGKP
jgi:hypothetical protein